MKNMLLKMSKKSVAILMALIMTMPLMLTGCDVDELLKDLATDYVVVSMFNTGTLLCESNDNSEICTFEICVEVTNGYIMDLTNAIIELHVPGNVTVTKNIPNNVRVVGPLSDQRITGEIITVEENVEYNWLVQIPKSNEIQNIEYYVSVSSDISNEVDAYGSFYVEGKNASDNRLDFASDTWSFGNYDKWPVPLKQEEYDALMFGVDNTTRESFEDFIPKNGGTGGYCFGMSATVILTKMGRLSLSNFNKPRARNLHSLSQNKDTESVIGYYHLLQCVIWNDIVKMSSASDTEKISYLEKLCENVEKGGTPVLLCYTPNVNEEGGHAVVAFAAETRQSEFNGKKYDSVIVVYNPDHPECNEDYYIYYNKNTSEYYIPGNPQASLPYYVTADLNNFDFFNLSSRKKSVNSYITARKNHNLTVYTEDNELVGNVNQGNVSDSSVGMVSFPYIGGDENDLIIAIPLCDKPEQSFKIAPQAKGESLDLSIEYDNFYLAASGENQESIVFNPNGNVEINGTATDFNIQITANEGYYSTDWYKLSVSGASGTNPKVEIADKGYILSGEDLTDVTVYAENTETANKLNLKTDETAVFITQEGENLCVKSDEDKDGQYETILATGTTTTPNDPTSGGSGFNLGSGVNFGGGLGAVNSWIIILIAGVLLISVIVAVIIIAFHSKKKKNNDEFEVPVIKSDDTADSDTEVIEESNVILSGIQVLTGNMSGQKFEIVDAQTATIGKDPKLANILLDASYNLVSRVHCTVTYSVKFNKYFVIDCSSNGTYLENGTRLAKNTRTPIARGSVLKLADDNCLIKLI